MERLQDIIINTKRRRTSEIIVDKDTIEVSALLINQIMTYKKLFRIKQVGF